MIGNSEGEVASRNAPGTRKGGVERHKLEASEGARVGSGISDLGKETATILGEDQKRRRDALDRSGCAELS